VFPLIIFQGLAPQRGFFVSFIFWNETGSATYGHLNKTFFFTCYITIRPGSNYCHAIRLAVSFLKRGLIFQNSFGLYSQPADSPVVF
jgi:hypothetical protein